MEDFSIFIPKVHFELIPIKNLVSHQEYQRNLSLTHIERAAENFDIHQINPVKVSRRDGINYVFNGQHTVEIIALVSGSRDTPVWCMIYDELEYENEANIFANQMKYVKPLLPYEIFMATIYSNLTYNMLLLNDILEGNFIQVDAIYFDNLSDLDELNKKIINIIPENIEYRIINNEDKNIIFKNYEDLMTEKEFLLKRKRDKAREKYNNMTEEEHEELNRKRRNKYNNIK